MTRSVLLAGAVCAVAWVGAARVAVVAIVDGGLDPATPRGAWLLVLVASLAAVPVLAAVTLPREGGSARLLLVFGVVAGIAWAAGLRGFMAAAAGPESTVSWIGTFGFILLPGAVVGGLLARGEHRRRGGARRRVLAPLVFALDPAALVLVLPAMAGGWVLAGRGTRRARWFAGAAAFLPVPVYVLAVLFLDDIRTLATPAGAANALLLFSCVAVLALACAAPQRAPVRTDPTHDRTAVAPPVEIPAPRSPDRARRRPGVGVRR